MAQSVFYPYFQPAIGYFGSVLNAVLGRGGGKFRRSNYFQPINQKLILIDTSPGSLMNVAMQVPHLNTVISTGAELFSLMEIKHFDKNKEEIPFEKSNVLKFLKQPNPLQSREQYLYDFYVLNAVYNKTFQYKIQALSFEKVPKAMWLLPSGWMKINATGKIYRQTDINEIIESFEMQGQQGLFEVDKVIYMTEGLGNNPLNPISRIESLQIPLSNIIASLKSRNIIVSERGMIGFLTPDGGSGNSDGQLPYDEKEHKRIREEYQNQYDLDARGHVGFPKIPMKWVPMTFDIHQLGLIEGLEDDFSAVIAAFRHDRDMYPSVKGATFENKAAGMRSTIQNALQPLADKLMEQLAKHLIDEGSGEYLVASYEYLPCMQEDQLKLSQANQVEGLRLSKLYADGVITIEQYAQLAGVDYEPEANVVNASQKNLRGLVGSVTGIIQVNQFVAQGFIDRNTAVNIIMASYGYDKPTATSMITTLTVDLNTPAPSTTVAKE